MNHFGLALLGVPRLALLSATLALIAAPLPAVRAQILGPGVYAWGYNAYGQLGNGTTIDSSTPVRVAGLSGVHVTSVTAGDLQSLALTGAGAAYAWGYNAAGQLGNGTTNDAGTPIPVTGLSGVAVTAAAGEGLYSVALSSTGAVYAWGSNYAGQLGNGTTTNSSTPVLVTGLSGANITAVAAGSAQSLALTGTGAIYAWGRNTEGELGNGTFSSGPTATPVPVTGLSGLTVAAIAAGSIHSLAVTTTGAVYAWGSNGDGQLGNGTTTGSPTPFPVTGLSGVDVTAVAAGVGHSLALTSTGSVYAWGLNFFGQLGNGTTNNALSALLVPLPANGSATVVAIAAGAQDSFALESDGSLWAWGQNFYGQYGNGTTTNSLTPIEVFTPTGGYGISAFAEGSGHSLAIVTPIPEPGSLGLVAAAAGAVGAWRQRRCSRAVRPA